MKFDLNSICFILITSLLLQLCFVTCQDTYIQVDANSNTDNSNSFILINPYNKQFLVFWHSQTASLGFEIYGKKFDINGISIGGETKINNLISNRDQTNPIAAFLSESKIIVIWNSFANDTIIQGRIIDPNLSTNNLEFQINSPNDDKAKYAPSLCILSNERFIVFYNYFNGVEYNIYASIYNSNQNLLKEYFKLNERGANSLNDRTPSCVEFSDNRFLIVYLSFNQMKTNIEIFGKVFDNNYNLIKEEFNLENGSGFDYSPIVSKGPNDEILISYSIFNNYQYDVYYKILNKDFTQIIKQRTIVNSYTKDNQTKPFSRKIEENKFLICWVGNCNGCSKWDFSCRIVDFQGNYLSQDLRISKENSQDKLSVRFSNFNNQQIIFTFTYSNYLGKTSNNVYLSMYNLYQRVNNFIDKEQTYPLTIALNNGGFIIIWLCEQCSGSSNKFLFKLNDQIDGLSADSEIAIVSKSEISDTNYISGVKLTNGNIFIVWDHMDSYSIPQYKQIYGKIINDKGFTIKEKFKISYKSTYEESSPKIVSNKKGLNLIIFIYCYPCDINTTSYLAVLFYDDSANSPKRFSITFNNTLLQKSDICYIGNDTFLILYINKLNLFGGIQTIQSFSKFPSTPINTESNLIYNNAACSMIGKNRIIIIMSTDTYKVFFKIYNNDNSYSLIKDQTLIDDSSFQKKNPNLISLLNGDFVIGWEERDRDGSGLGVYYKSFDSIGNKLIESTLVNSFTYKDQKNISLAQLTDSTIVVAYSSFGDGDGNGINYDFIINCPKDRFIDSLFNNRCSLCNPPCSSCQGTAQNCISCVNGYYRLEPNQNTCVNTPIPNNYLQIPIPSDGYYLKCADMCASCVNTINNCKTCKSQTARLVEISNGIINCLEDITGYYLPSGSVYYKKCPVNCSTCTLDTNCTSCITNYYLADINLGDTRCIDNLIGLYLPINGKVYKKCSSSCKTCENNENNCKSCFDNFYLALNPSNSFECIRNISNYFLISGQNFYQLCNEKCATCIEFPTKCLSCNTSKLYYPIKFTYDCVKSCPDGYWFNFLEQNYQKCDPSCKKCLDNTKNCLECTDGFFPLKDNKSLCFKDCPINYTLNYVEKYCQPGCISPCKTCTDPNNCFSCVENYFLIASSNNINNCVLNCPDGFYNDNVSFKCQLCPFNCKTCKSQDKCLSCKNELFYLQENNLCLKNCPIKYYPQNLVNDESIIKINESKNICKKCKAECSVCTGSQDNCLSCEQGYFFLAQNKDCLIDCPQGFYKDFSNQQCIACSETCLECKGSLINDCIKCNEDQGLILNNGLCIKDPGNSKIICPLGYFELEKNCRAYKTCIQNFNAFFPKIFSIDIEDFIIKIDLKFKMECIMFWNKFSVIWDKENPYYVNSNFSNDYLILTIKNEYLKEGIYNFSIRLFFGSFQIENSIFNVKFQIDNVSILKHIEFLLYY